MNVHEASVSKERNKKREEGGGVESAGEEESVISSRGVINTRPADCPAHRAVVISQTIHAFRRPREETLLQSGC